MNILFIGGTGKISTTVSRMAVERGLELYLLNRGQAGVKIDGARSIVADVHKQQEVRDAIRNLDLDVVVDWIAYNTDDIERDIGLFAGRVKQFIFISSATVYEKPPSQYIVTESTPLNNPFWDYARDKIACENLLMKHYREKGFPVTIVRPTFTYNTYIPVAIGGFGCCTFADRLKKGLPIIVHGDGSALWVMTHAEDFARGFLGLVGNTHAIGQAFHITSDEVLNWNQIYTTIAAAFGVEPNLVHIPTDFIVTVAPELEGTLLGDKTWSVVFDNTKIKSTVPEFRTTILFQEGIRRAVEWLENHPDFQRIEPAQQKQMENIIAAWSNISITKSQTPNPK